MPLYRLLQQQAFDPKQIEAMVAAFEMVCRQRNLRPLADDAQRELVAQRVIEFAQRGELDPHKLRDLVSNAL